MFCSINRFFGSFIEIRFAINTRNSQNMQSYAQNTLVNSKFRLCESNTIIFKKNFLSVRKKNM